MGVKVYICVGGGELVSLIRVYVRVFIIMKPRLSSVCRGMCVDDRDWVVML